MESPGPVGTETLSYMGLVFKMCDYPLSARPTVGWHRRGGEAGTMMVDSEPITLTDGMVFVVVDTNGA